MRDIRGWVGFSRQRGVIGWLADEAAVDHVCTARILVNGIELAVLPADEYREHLAARGMRNPLHGFTCPLPEDLDPNRVESVVLESVDEPSFRVAARIDGPARQPVAPKAEAAPKAKTDDDSGDVEALQQKVRELAGDLENRRREVERLKGFKQANERLVRQADRAVEDAAAKMWGGYTDHGRSELLSIAMSPATPPSSQARAFYALARHDADTGRVHAGVRMMARARRASPPFMWQLRPRLLEVDLLMRSGAVGSARARLEEHHRWHPEVPDYRIGLANVARLEGSMAGMQEVLDDMFAAAGLAPVAWTDPAAPFLTLHCPEPPAPVEDGPKVSVLMSCYNAADYLRLAIGSMQAQSWRNLEILVTDDCSTDGSREILHEIAAEDPRVVVIENGTNLGTYGNRNAMLERCTGDFVTVHDSDDWSHPQMIERQVRHLLDNPDIRLNTTLMCRVSPEMAFHLRPSRHSLEYCHMNYPGFMLRREDIVQLGGWDPIMANADAEFERRVKQVHGRDAFAVIDREVPFSFFLVHGNSLTQQPRMNLRSLTFGSRYEYHRQSEHWMDGRRREAEESGDPVGPFALEGRSGAGDPFPCPNSLMIPALKREVLDYDVLILSDMFLLGGTRGCNVNYVRALHAMGRRVGLFHWPRADLRFLADVDGAYRDLAQQGLADIVTWEDRVRAKRVILHHPPSAAHELDSYPEIEAERASVLVNQLPFQTTERDQTFYDPAAVDARLRRILGVETVDWIAISPLTRAYLGEYADDIRLSDEIWYPPYLQIEGLVTRDTASRLEALRAGKEVMARHARDHWTKWPATPERLRSAYMVGEGAALTLLGGGKSPARVLGGQPESWTVHDYDSISVPDLLNGADVYLNFNNEVYIEEFGRNVMEAMAFGLPVLADPVFSQVFGEAILPVEHHRTAPVLERLRSEPGLFEDQVARGRDFVARNCSAEALTARLERFLG